MSGKMQVERHDTTLTTWLGGVGKRQGKREAVCVGRRSVDLVAVGACQHVVVDLHVHALARARPPCGEMRWGEMRWGEMRWGAGA